MDLIYTLISVFLVSIISFIGVFTLAWKRDKLEKITFLLVSLSAGTLLGDSFFHLLPEALKFFQDSIMIWIILLAGMILFFIMEKIVCWRHCHVPTTHDHPHPLGIMNLVGDGVHNFLDGLVIGTAFIASLPIGIATSLAVILHEIPQEISDFGVLIHAGYSKKRALMLNFLIALTAILGALLSFTIVSTFPNFEIYLLPFAAGGFIYIATADLIPELKKNIHPGKSIFELLFIVTGLGIMYLLKIYSL